ncbi:MAG: hypothetical protein JXB49_14505, partial [Bacteroidales bacterium]|nr:hypothetical protein [Bacteroidales bacterium]
MDTIGIHIRAKANLEEVESAARKLENFGGSASQAGSKVQQLVESVKDSAGTDINQLTQQIEALQKKIQQPGMSDKERKHSKEELNNLKDQIKELRMLQRIKADDFGSMEQETRLYLEHLKNKKALTNAEKEHIKEIEKGLAYLDKYNKSKLDLDEAHLNKMQKDLQAQEEQAQKAGLNLGGMGAYGGRMVKQITGLVIGGSIIAIAVQAVKKWADLDTQITKTGVSLDGLSKNSVEGITRIGNALGYTKEEGLAYLDVLTAISGIINDTEIGGFKNLLTYGRGTGVGGQTGVQMREIQRWSGEGVKPGTDKYFLSQFTAIARMLSMREGRMTEFIETAIELTKTMEKTFIKVDEKDIFRNILFPSMVFGGSDRGRGQRGLSFMQRLNENVGGGGDLMDLMMYRTIGVPQNWEQMWNLKKVREQGVFGTIEPGGEPLIMGLIRNFEKMFGGEEYINANKDIRDEYEETGEKLILDDNTQKMYNEKRARIMASMKSAMPGISTVEIEEMYKMYEGLQRGNWSMQIGSLSKEVQ